MLEHFLWGALAMGSLVSALFFFRFWRDTRERLFVVLGAAFVAFAVNWIVLATVRADDETRHYVYFVRLVAFMLILVGIIDKNRRRT